MATSILKKITVFMLILLMTNLTQVIAADNAMIPTSVFVNELTREQSAEKISGFLNRSEVRQQLIANGLSSEEVSRRLATLSDTETNYLIGQMDGARAGGDFLITVLIVVLIIFLVQRI